MIALARDRCTEFEIEEPVRRETTKALLVVIDGTERWVPKSQIHDDSEVYEEGGTGELVVSEWWATREGLV